MGRTTTFSVAQVRDVHLHVPATYPDKNGTLARVGFSDVCLTSFYTAGGDSGSGVLDMQGNVVGLHMAGSTVVGIFCKIKNVMDALGVEVVTQANQNGCAGRPRSHHRSMCWSITPTGFPRCRMWWHLASIPMTAPGSRRLPSMSRKCPLLRLPRRRCPTAWISTRRTAHDGSGSR